MIGWSRSFDRISATQLWWSMYLYSLCFCISLLHFGRLVCTICCSAPFAIMNHSEAFYWFYLPSFFSSWLNIIFSEKATKISSNTFRFDWLESPTNFELSFYYKLITEEVTTYVLTRSNFMSVNSKIFKTFCGLPKRYEI